MAVACARHSATLKGAGRTGFGSCRFEETVELDTYVGGGRGSEAERLPDRLGNFNVEQPDRRTGACGQDVFLEAVAESARPLGPAADPVVFLGTSTSGLMETELAYRRRVPARVPCP